MKIALIGDVPELFREQLEGNGHVVSVFPGPDLPEDREGFDLVCHAADVSKGGDHFWGTTVARDKVLCGLTYNVKRDATSEIEAEFDAPATIDALEKAIAENGLDVVRLEAAAELPGRLREAAPDIVFNIAEGWRGRSRESQVPALLEFEGIPVTGSDSVSIGLTLDKALAKKLVAQAGLNTPDFQVIPRRKATISDTLSYPVIVKPSSEGSSKGVAMNAVAHDPHEARDVAQECLAKFGPPVLVEEYVEGREFTVGLVGNRRPVVLPPLEVVFKPAAGDYPVYGYEIKQETIDGADFVCPADLDTTTHRRLKTWTRKVFAALELRDVARIDLRMDSSGQFHFIEVNPLPGLTPGFSDLCTISDAAGLNYHELVGYILRYAMQRQGFSRKHWPELPSLQERIAAIYDTQTDLEP